ncbi:uncharacterized protein [Ptychodera flava]|uniref:uncharacterized protein n=1 Tax=Ptychodera flava TaxID=63121 RepID=UPI00396A86F7
MEEIINTHTNLHRAVSSLLWWGKYLCDALDAVQFKETESLPAPSEKSKKTDNKKKVSTKPDDNGKGENEFAAGNVGGSDPNDQTEKDDDKNASTDAGGESSAKDEERRNPLAKEEENTNQPSKAGQLDRHTHQQEDIYSDDDDAAAYSEDSQPGKVERSKKKPSETTSNLGKEESKPRIRHRFPETSQPEEEENTNRPSKAGQRDKSRPQAEDAFSCDDDDDDDDGGGGDDDDVHEQASFLQGNINEHSRQGNVYFILILVVF